MNKEIERKFAVKEVPPDLRNSIKAEFVQTYAFGLRFRAKEANGHTVSFVTYKGPASESGMSRTEIEKVCPNWIVRLVHLLCKKTVHKTRYYLPIYTRRLGFPILRCAELDIYHGANKGLMTVEVELGDEIEEITPPDWFGDELTGDKKYDNYSLATTPYTTWKL